MNLRQEYFCPSNKEGLLRYLLVKTSPVMMKVKPAMLVRISNCFRAREFQPYDIFCMHQKTILETLAVDYVIMKNNGSDIQVLFYDIEVLENTLKNDRVKSFLKEFNYRDEWSVSECLDELRSRFSSSDFPHEIGIFLGYPLEDVRGFISDYSSGISVPQGRWRIYGDIAKSLKTMTLYRHAEELGKIIIKDYHDVSICIEKIRNSVITEQIELGT